MGRHISALVIFLLASQFVMAEPPSVNMLAFSTDGKITARSTQNLNRIIAPEVTAPTHIYVLSHGWNNTYSDAVDSYQRILAHMDIVANQYTLRPSDYRPLVVGIYWPSKAGSDDSRNRSASEDFHVADARDVLDPAMLEKQSPPLPPSTWNADVATINELVALPVESLTSEDYKAMNLIFKRYRLGPSDGEGESADVFGSTVERGADLSPFDVLGLLSFWNKKELAGVVGKNGVGPVLSKLQSRFPSARMHLFGHSFGAKVVLSALTKEPSIRPVSSVVLIQPAISCLALSPNGGYESALTRVSGPIVATFSDYDRALALPYSAASRLAGQNSERSVSGYSAMGSIGPDPDRFRIARMVRPSASNMYLWDRAAPIGIDGSDYITGHSEFYNSATARLIWSVVLDAEPAAGGTRSVSQDQLLALLNSSRDLSRNVADKDDPSAYVSAFSDAFRSSLQHGKRITGIADRSASVDISFSPTSLDGGLQTVFGAKNRSIILTNKQAVRNLQMIIDKNPSFNEMMIQIVDPHTNPIVRDQSEPQCVCVGWRRTVGFTSSRARDAGWNWEGSGCVVKTSNGEVVVVTAAHVKPQLVNVDEIEFGVLVGDCFNDPRERKIFVAKKRLEHKMYDREKKKNDLAVLRFEGGLNLGGAEPFSVGEVPSEVGDSGQVLHVVGFGSTDGQPRMAFDGFKRHLILPLVPVEYNEAEAVDFGLNNGLEFVAGKVGAGVDTCYGDSGGPAYIIEGGTKKLIGCIVRGVKNSCGDGTVQLRLSRYIDFVEECAREK